MKIITVIRNLRWKHFNSFRNQFPDYDLHSLCPETV